MKIYLNVSQIVGYSSKLVRFGLHMQPGDETGKIVILSHVVIVLVNALLNCGFGLYPFVIYP